MATCRAPPPPVSTHMPMLSIHMPCSPYLRRPFLVHLLQYQRFLLSLLCLLTMPHLSPLLSLPSPTLLLSCACLFLSTRPKHPFICPYITYPLPIPSARWGTACGPTLSTSVKFMHELKRTSHLDIVPTPNPHQYHAIKILSTPSQLPSQRTLVIHCNPPVGKLKMENPVVYDNGLNLEATELRLGLPGTNESAEKQSSSSTVRSKKRSSSEITDDTRSKDGSCSCVSDAPPPAK